jgi:hypothetical protein
MTATRVVKNAEPIPSRAELSANPLEAAPQPVVASKIEEVAAPPAPMELLAPAPPVPTETTIREVGEVLVEPAAETAPKPVIPVSRKIALRSKSAIVTEKETKATTERQRYKDAETEEIQHQRYLLVPDATDPSKRLPSAFHPPTRAGFGNFLYTTFRSFTLEPIRQDLTQDACKKMMAGPGSGNQVEMFLYQKFIRENRALGECDHPESSVIELKNTSHIIREAHMEGDDVYGSVELLDTPSGQILKSLVMSGVTLGISSRGVGSVKPQGGNQIVQEDFQLICFDMVSEPSTPGAFMMKEGRNIRPTDLDKTFTRSDKINRIFNDITSWRGK